MHHENALCSLHWGGANIATLWRSRADLRQVQPAHELALEKLVTLLDDQDEIETAHAEFRAINNSTNELSSRVLDLINNNVDVRSSS